MAKLATDPEFRRQYFSGRSELPQAPVEAFAETLLRKRLGAVRRLLPDSNRAWGGRFAELFRRHAGAVHRSSLDDALHFASILAGQADPEAAVSRRELRRLRVHSRFFAAKLCLDKTVQFFRDLIPHSPERR